MVERKPAIAAKGDGSGTRLTQGPMGGTVSFTPSRAVAQWQAEREASRAGVVRAGQQSRRRLDV